MGFNELSHSGGLLALVGLLGMIQTLTPDRWSPLSLYTWQKKWSETKTFILTTFFMLLHIFLGVGLFLALSPLNLPLGALWLGVIAIALYRFQHYEKIREVFWFSKDHGLQALYRVFLLLGPCELLVPVLVKATQSDISLRQTVVVFTGGVLIAAWVAVFWGKTLWNRPAETVLWFERVNRSVRRLPWAVALVLATLTFMRTR